MSEASNAVDIDRESIMAELGELAPPIEPSSSPEAPAGAPVQSVNWDEALSGAVEMFSSVVAPNWALTADEKGVIAIQGARVLEAFFPDFRLDGKWLVLGVYVISVTGIVMKRYDPERGEFKPLHMKRAEPATEAPAPAARSSSSSSSPASAPEPVQAVRVPASAFANVSG